jgi:hypothetical protein
MLIDEFGGYLPTIRWDMENGELLLVATNEVFEKEVEPIELNTAKSTFVWDMRTRERGRVRIEAGIYNAIMAPAGQEVPPLPPGEDPTKYKPMLARNVWNPYVGLARIEASSTYYRAAIWRIWQLYSTAPEAAEGLMPVSRFVSRRETSPKRFPNKLFLTPVTDLVGWLPRDKIQAFAALEPTVPLPTQVVNDSQLAEVLRAKLEAPSPKKESARKSKNGELPDDGVEDIG